nr:acyl-CoA thioester hydrolase/BAAT C-terminal domain-containing protein [Mucilaginibacter sp. L294]
MKKLEIVLFLFLITTSANTFAQELNTPGVNSRLYLGTSDNQPLIVGFGGSEGGNAWASNYWKPTRDQFIAKGYAFLALGYFGCKGAPDTLDRIAIDQVHNAILEAAKNPKINRRKIAIIGGSRGGDIALLIGSYYPDIKCVVAIVPSHVAFPGHTANLSTSAWTYQGKELPFVPVNEEAVPFLMQHNLRGAFETMLKDTVAEQKALIKVENINGPILFLSATKDEICPSTLMSDRMTARLKTYHFKYHNEHLVIAGSHSEPLKHFDAVFAFLDKHFK